MESQGWNGLFVGMCGGKVGRSRWLQESGALNHLAYLLSILWFWLNPASLGSGRITASITLGIGELSPMPPPFAIFSLQICKKQGTDQIANMCTHTPTRFEAVFLSTSGLQEEAS